MTNTIAVMNTKGGVGKSTIVMALAETLSASHGKTVLVIDSDSQASVSSMFMTTTSLHKLQAEGLTIVDFLVASVLNDKPDDWSKFVVSGVCDVDDARSVYVLPSDMQLTLFEREVSKEALHGRLRTSIRSLLAGVRDVFDIVLVDCPPGLSVLTESWLREADWHISPTKPDYVSSCGLEVLRRFKSLNPEMGFAANLGVLINMKDEYSGMDHEYHRWLADNADNNCFEQAVPRANVFQKAAQFQPDQRSYYAKYPGDSGRAMQALANEVLARMEAGKAEMPSSVAPAVPEKIVEQGGAKGSSTDDTAAASGSTSASGGHGSGGQVG